MGGDLEQKEEAFRQDQKRGNTKCVFFLKIGKRCKINNRDGMSSLTCGSPSSILSLCRALAFCNACLSNALRSRPAPRTLSLTPPLSSLRSHSPNASASSLLSTTTKGMPVPGRVGLPAGGTRSARSCCCCCSPLVERPGSRSVAAAAAVGWPSMAPPRVLVAFSPPTSDRPASADNMSPPSLPSATLSRGTSLTNSPVFAPERFCPKRRTPGVAGVRYARDTYTVEEAAMFARGKTEMSIRPSRRQLFTVQQL